MNAQISIQQRFLNFCKPAYQKASAFFKNHETIKKICQVVLHIFVIALTCLSYLANPLTTLTGFLVGIIFPDNVKEIASRIRQFLSEGWWLHVTIATVACFALLPLVAYMGATFLWSAHVGQWATEFYPKPKEAIVS